MTQTRDNHSWCEELYEARASQLLLYGRALGFGHGESEDILQEVFVSLVKLETPPSQPEHYCVRAFRNRALNYKRSFWRRFTRELESVRWFERNETESPMERAAMKCLSELPADQREVIVLKLWHEHTFEEIGELTGVSQNTAAGRYRYGIQKIRSCLKGIGNESPEQFGEYVEVLDSASSLRTGA